ncbi:hypothetical protein AN639_12405 [Candidatus Epulonipiscium fishelsonii]|uniref:Uncharacterized protein n=1 Tax=Candidatus Epulonipiscium fishelsonii TaxID=77094 RepID=A0ACC8XCF5_9FIRM|nr:hypothetical protein AN396_01175 [Epulopiscium sp. SCG-B11WGA-EpuloA1]ONI42455.1 hypothetical protein AN639_12405 [Epulopiscium sp. SCG-B05WGA-EpuloA1]
MRILIIGAVAAGTSAAAKARRNDDSAEITIYEQDVDISYSGCGLPYYIGGEIEDIDELTPRNPEFFKKKYNIDVKTSHKVVKVYSSSNTLTVKNINTDEIFMDYFDKLIIATGAVPAIPNIEGIQNNNVFSLRNVQSAKSIRSFIQNNNPRHVVIVGSGFIGFEMLENLMGDGMNVTIVEKQNKLTPSLDNDMSMFLENILVQKGINILKGATLTRLEHDKVVLEVNTLTNSEDNKAILKMDTLTNSEDNKAILKMDTLTNCEDLKVILEVDTLTKFDDHKVPLYMDTLTNHKQDKAVFDMDTLTNPEHDKIISIKDTLTKTEQVKVILEVDTLTKINSAKSIFNSKIELHADMVIMSTGIIPNVNIAQEAGVEIGVSGAIKVNDQMQTNFPDIYACGDCIETFSQITGKPVYKPLGSTANKTGRIAGDVVTGGNLRYKGNLGTGIFKLFDLTIANTGLSEAEAVKEGYDIQVCHNIKPDKPSYFKGKEMVIKAIADKKTEKILGVQIIGYDGVDKRIDVFATLITYGAKVDELFHLDLAYAPPFSTTKDPIHYTGMILDNAMNNNRPLITSAELKNLVKSGEKVQIIDARVSKQFEKSSVDGAVNMPHATLRDTMKSLEKDTFTVTYCNKGVTGNAAQNILLNNGFTNVCNLSGGHKFYK